MCSPGNLLFGIIRPDGRVVALQPPLPVTQTFADKASAAGRRPPEARFRFAGPCVTSDCLHWKDERCGLGDAVARTAESRGPAAKVAHCAIRPSCRWWHEQGGSACQVCPRIAHTEAPIAEA